MFDATKYAVGTIVERRDLTEDLWTMRIEPDCEIPFRPGQYVTVGLEIDGRMVERPYSIASAPHESAIELFIERVPAGELSFPLHSVGIGGKVALRKRAKGLFLKNAPLDATTLHLFVATVTGVAPFVAVVRHHIALWQQGAWQPTGQLVVLQGASRAHEFGYEVELQKLAAEIPWFSYIPTVSRPWEEAHWTGERGRVEDVLRKYADQVAVEAGAVFLCGHPGMISNARAIMRRAGMADERVFEEQYWPD